MSSDSIKAAMLANASIAAAKTFGAVTTGSASMMAEAIHSASDCGNQLLLMWGVKSSAKEADVNHPLGYGMNVYFWSFIVALVLFSLGGVYSVYEGIHKVLAPEPLKNVEWAIGILLFGVIMEGRSFLICLKEIKALHPGKSFQWFFKETRSPELLVIFAEDLAALIGLAIALVFLTIAWLTGNPIFDAIGSLFVGILLVAVAAFLFLEIKALMIGQSVDPVVRRALREHIFHKCDQIEHTYDCTTLQMGSEAVLLMRVRMVEKEDAKKIIEDIDAIEKSISEKFPQFTTIFIEPANKFEDF
jgi:cation diffusion facilitator family transporter